VPLSEERETTDLPLEGTPAACSMGNPHCTYFTDDISDETLLTVGPATENNPLFPERTNVQLVQVIWMAGILKSIGEMTASG